ncbi:hypothetical protein [Nannocystis punicea]|uniref:Uncharacterized protein n=1 Tax=Nannocystis punicea TaxID=2995304 RepID=A0ABY7HFQ8_9BACT|nr:hypothetical protein [Nannocystis poenicansa]WAS97907.1 hypothetical protein O0S08_17335 [Nannocystis poenicansa]
MVASGCEEVEPFAEDAELSPADELAAGGEEAVARGGTSMQSRYGLTCSSRWDEAGGATNCGGTPGVKWRLKVRCWWQGERLGAWKSGPGNDRIACSLGAESSRVVWG